MDLEFRPCCRGEVEAGGKRCFKNAVGAKPFTQLPVLVVQEEKPPKLSTAYHEAGHAVVAGVLGLELIDATVRVQPMAQFHVPRGTPRPIEMATDLAGPVAERWSSRFAVRSSDEALQPYLARVLRGRNGTCDECKAITHAFMTVTSLEDREIFAEFRRVEALTVELIQNRLVWSAIRELAELLMKEGTVSGDAITQIYLRKIDPQAIEAIKKELLQ